MRDHCTCRQAAPVILIEVDNKRAHTAYCKALEELADIYPRRLLDETQRHREEFPDHWRCAAANFGTLPQIGLCLERVNRIAHRRDLAGLAISPFRMTESAADELLKCESGLFAMEVRAQFAQAALTRRVEAPTP